MKITNPILLIFILFTFFGNNPKRSSEEDIVISNIIKSYTIDFKKFHDDVNDLANYINEPKINISNIKKQLIDTRLSFKKVEFIFDYDQPSFNYAFINGAPLPKFSDKYGNGQIIKPNGLQALDELIFDEDYVSKIETIKTLANLLQERVNFISEIHLNLNLKSAQVIEALRSGVIRVFTLGITGFDSPGYGNAMQESLESFKAMKNAFSLYKKQVLPKAKPKFKAIVKLFEKGEKALKQNPDFDSFDRLTFLKQIINPLYKDLFDFQKLNSITKNPFKFHAQNYESKNLFDSNFLKPEFYSEFVYLPLDNPLTIQLGKKLFNDPRLSKNSTMSCVTCHDPKKGFADGLPKSITNKAGVFAARNSPTIINVGYSTRYF